MTNAPTQSQARARQMLEQAYAPASSGLDLEAEMMLQGIGPAINTLASALTPASDDATVERVRGLHGALKAFSADPSNKRVIHVHLDRDATAEDRQALLDALNSAVLPPRTSDDVAKLREAGDRLAAQVRSYSAGNSGLRDLGPVLNAWDAASRAALADGENGNG